MLVLTNQQPSAPASAPQAPSAGAAQQKLRSRSLLSPPVSLVRKGVRTSKVTIRFWPVAACADGQVAAKSGQQSKRCEGRFQYLPEAHVYGPHTKPASIRDWPGRDGT